MLPVLFLNCKIGYTQSSSFKEGDNTISAGYGWGNYEPYVLNLDPHNHQSPTTTITTTTGPIYLKYDYAHSNIMSWGVDVAYAQFNLTNPVTISNFSRYYTGTSTYHEHETYTTCSVLFRWNWHFSNGSKFDPYGGLGLGFKYGAFNYSTDAPINEYYYFDSNRSSVFPLGFETTIGARYYFTDFLALYCETGLAKSAIQFGATFKIR